LLIKKAVKVTPKIKNFEKYIPKDVVLTNLTYSKGIINIAGTSTNYNSITAFAANLQMSKEYPLARIIKIDSSVGYIFTIMISE